MENKRALFITLDSPHIDRRILLFAKALKEIGFQSIILATHAEVECGFEDIEIINLSYDKKRVKTIIKTKEVFKKYSPDLLFNLAKKLYRKFLTSYEYIPFYKELVKKAVEIEANIYISCDLPTLPIGYRAKLLNKALLIYDAHEFYTGQVALSYKDKAKLSNIERNLIRKVDLLITVNEDIADLFKQQYSYKNVQVILNATLCKKNKKRYLHDIIGINVDIPILLYQGGFTRNRNLDKLIRLSSYLNKSVLVMLGWGIIERDLKNKAKALNILNKKVFFIPKISQSELISYTASASLGIIPYPSIDINTKYCTPNKLFEYICGEVPIAANKELITVNNMLKQYRIGFSVDFNNIKEAALTLENMLANDIKLKFYKTNLSIARKLLNWENEKKKLQKIVLDLVAKEKRR